MTAASAGKTSPVFELKSATLPLVALILKTTDMSVLGDEFARRHGDDASAFDNDPVVVDLHALEAQPQTPDMAALMALLGDRKLRPLAFRGGNAEQRAAALAAGLVEAPDLAPPPAVAPQASAPPRAPERPVEPPPGDSGKPVDAAKDASASKKEPRDRPAATAATMIVDRPLRSGQQVYARGGDLVVLAAVNFGAEVIADGSIHVYAPLRGRAVAGARGNAAARIFSTCMEPQLISIAGTYRTTDTPLAADVLGKSAQVRLDGETLVVEPLGL